MSDKNVEYDDCSLERTKDKNKCKTEYAEKCEKLMVKELYNKQTNKTVQINGKQK